MARDRASTPLKVGVGSALLACSFLLGSDLTAPQARGALISQWTEPWQVTLPSPILGGSSAAASRAFGASSTADGQINDRGAAGDSLPDTDAVAKAKASVGSSVIALQTATAEVDFARHFLLSGSPTGWYVTISLDVAGTLKSGDTTSAATIQALFEIVGVGGVPFGKSVSGEGGNLTVAQGPQMTFILPDGTYNAHGTLLVTAQNDDLLGSASSNFFDTVVGRVTATAVPEPSSLILAALGSIFVGVRLRSRKA